MNIDGDGSDDRNDDLQSLDSPKSSPDMGHDKSLDMDQMDSPESQGETSPEKPRKYRKKDIGERGSGEWPFCCLHVILLIFLY